MKPGPKKGTKFVENPREKFCISWEPETLKKLREIAEERKMSLSRVVEQAFVEYLERGEK